MCANTSAHSVPSQSDKTAIRHDQQDNEANELIIYDEGKWLRPPMDICNSTVTSLPLRAFSSNIRAQGDIRQWLRHALAEMQ